MASAMYTHYGEDWVVDKVVLGVTASPQFVGWGTGAGGLNQIASKNRATVYTEGPESRATGTVTKTGSSESGKVSIVATLTASAGHTINNMGVFILSAGGSAVVTQDHAGQILAANDAIQYTVTIDPT